MKKAQYEAKKFKGPRGFISIVAMVIFAMLIIMGLSVQRTTIDALQNIKNSNNYLSAKNKADSVSGYLISLQSDHNAGFNEQIHCEYANGELLEKPLSPNLPKLTCIEFQKLINPCTIPGNEDRIDCKTGVFKNEEVLIDAEIKGRTEATLQGGICLSFSTGCYTVPEITTGTAGKNCKLYTPNLSNTTELENECNWNKLSFGSSATDRVVIPMYYEDENGTIIEPTFGSTLSENFMLRVRTPCKEYNEDNTCKTRYTLNTADGNDIIVQWQITGTCTVDGKEVECGILPWVKYQNNGTIISISSAIDENRINAHLLIPSVFYFKYEVLSDSIDYSQFALNSNNYSILPVPLLNTLLENIHKPTFNIFLNKPLYDGKDNIPYLEYQFLTPHIISNPQSEIYSRVTVNGNTNETTIYKSVKGALIDFAIQN